MRQLTSAIALALSGATLAESMAYAQQSDPWPVFQFSYKYPKKQNKLSQKAKRKRARRMGKYG